MSIPWRRIWSGVRVVLNIAIDLNDLQIIKVKELGTIKAIKNSVEKNVPSAGARHVS